MIKITPISEIMGAEITGLNLVDTTDDEMH